MAHKFKPGDKVIRTTAWTSNNHDWTGKPIQKDEVVTVRKAYKLDAYLVLLFEEIINPPYVNGKECGYNANNFAPYNPPRERIVYVAETLRETVKQLEPTN